MYSFEERGGKVEILAWLASLMCNFLKKINETAPNHARLRGNASERAAYVGAARGEDGELGGNRRRTCAYESSPDSLGEGFRPICFIRDNAAAFQADSIA